MNINEYELTDWISCAAALPTRIGVYERRYGDKLSRFAYFDGTQFKRHGATVFEAIDPLCMGEFPNRLYASDVGYWRGLAAEPNAAMNDADAVEATLAMIDRNWLAIQRITKLASRLRVIAEKVDA